MNFNEYDAITRAYIICRHERDDVDAGALRELNHADFIAVMNTLCDVLAMAQPNVISTYANEWRESDES